MSRFLRAATSRFGFARLLMFVLSIAVSGVLLAPSALPAPHFNIVRLGLDGVEHTDNNGRKYSEARGANQAGQIFGSSARSNGGSSNLGGTVWFYDGMTTTKIGLTGIEHTRNDGYKLSESPISPHPNEAGQVTGTSLRFNGGSTNLGQSAWLFDGSTTIDIGLTGAAYTTNDGYKFSQAAGFNEAGQVVGWSNCYDGGGVQIGRTAWLHNGTATIDIGLTGPEHTSINGSRFSEVHEINDAGYAKGWSSRYNGGSADLGYSAWLFDGTSTINIGLASSEYTRNDGYKYSGVSHLNLAGQTTGASWRYNGGSTQLGQTAWFYDGTTTIDIGLTGSEHTRDDGFRSSFASGLNEAGQVTGSSNRYNGGKTQLGQSAWLYNGTSTIDLSLTGSEHTRNDGSRSSTPSLLSEAGHVVGYSNRYNGGSADLGRSVWLYDGATAINIGLTGAEHTRSNSYKLSSVETANSSTQWNDADQIIGRSNRYNGGGADLGQSAWLYNGGTTIDIGLNDSEHTRSNGYKYSYPYALNNVGQVIGFSNRYNGGSTQLGQDTWLYDPTLDQTIPLNFSTRSDGYAYSQAAYLGDDGLVLGQYTLFDALGNLLGSRAFYFTIADGMHDLGALVEGGLSANGWDNLFYANFRISGTGQILGFGKLTSQTSGLMPYLLTPIVPEPTSLFLMIAAGTTIFFSRRRFSTRRWSLAAITLAACAAAPDVAHAATLRTVALSGQQTPGSPSGVNFQRFRSHVVINDSGQTAFNAFDTVGLAVWSEGSGILTPVVRGGQQVPGAPAGVMFGFLESHYPTGVVLNNAGQTAFYAILAGSGFSETIARYSAWTANSAGLTLIAQGGAHAAGTPDGVKYFTLEQMPELNDAGQTLFSGYLSPDSFLTVGSKGIWLASAGGVAPVALQGDPAPGMSSAEYFSSFNAYQGHLPLNNRGQTAFPAYGYTSQNGTISYKSGIWSQRSGSLSLVALQGAPAPGLPDGVQYGSFMDGYEVPALNDAGQIAFRARISGPGVEYSNSEVVYSERLGSLAPVARSGTQAPGMPSGTNLGRFGEFVSQNNAGQIAFLAGLSGFYRYNGVNVVEDLETPRGIWSDVSGTLTLVAGVGSHAPGFPGGVNFVVDSSTGRNFKYLVMNDVGQVAFLAYTTFGQGIWATDRAGELQLIASVGELLEVTPGEFRTVNALFLNYNYGRRSTGFNNLGQVAFWARFTDGSEGIFVSNAVAVPEPGVFALEAVSFLCLLAQWRRRQPFHCS